MIAVTGAAGFIGSNLAHRLSKMGHELLLVDKAPPTERNQNWSGLQNFQFVSHHDFLKDTQPLQVLFHLGASSSTTETDTNLLRVNNVEYSQRLWDRCARERVPFIYASSAATYGNGSHGFDDRTPPALLHPLNAYGRSKNDFDQWVLQQCEQGRPSPPNWAGLKFFNVYGPREQHKGAMASVVLQAFRQIQENGSVRLFRSNNPDYPDGGQKRDFVYVEDCIDHMLWLWEHGTSPAIYNSGTGVARTFLDLVHAVFKALNREPSIQFIDMPPELSKQYQNWTCAEMSKLRAAGFDRTATSLEDSVSAYVRFLTNTYSVKL